MAKRIKNMARSIFDDEDNCKDVLLFCESSGLPYTIIESNYQLEIQSSFINIKFMQKQRGIQAFVAGNKIKKDIKLSGLEPPDIDPEDLIYFNFSMPERLKKGKHTIYNIDLKSAYANILKAHSIITPKTFAYMARLSKADRLACVGMLAAKKEIYHMIGNDVIEKEIYQLNTRNWFYFCVRQTNAIMDECKRHVFKDFLFYWVDGIFLDSEDAAKQVAEILTKKGVKFSYDICNEFEYKETEKNKKISYLKDGEKKELFLPKKNDKVDEFLIKFLSFHNNKKIQ